MSKWMPMLLSLQRNSVPFHAFTIASCPRLPRRKEATSSPFSVPPPPPHIPYSTRSRSFLPSLTKQPDLPPGESGPFFSVDFQVLVLLLPRKTYDNGLLDNCMSPSLFFGHSRGHEPYFALNHICKKKGGVGSIR